MRIKTPLVVDPFDSRWLTFIKSNRQANIFHHPSWLKLLAECYRYQPFILAVVNSSDEICAGLPVVEMRSPLRGQRWVSLPFTDHCIPLFKDNESLDKLTDYVVQFSSNKKIPKIELRWEFPARSTIHPYSHHVLHTVKLDPDREEVASHIQAKYRRLVRVAEEKGVHVEWGNTEEQLSTFYNLHLLNRRRFGIPIQPRKFFNLLWENLIKHDLGFILLAYKDNQCLAAAVFLHWQESITYKYSASSGIDRNLSPNDPLLWKAICWGCENGYSLFDLGRTEYSNSGLRYFKNRWGAEEVPLIYSVLGARPPQNTDGKLIRLAKTIIRNSPLWVCKASGELFYQHFG